MLNLALRDPVQFSRLILGRPLRPYQAEPMAAIVRSVLAGEGRTFTVMFARQMGKNELSAHLEAYLMTLFQRRGGTIVKAAPTYKPQVIASKLRLESTLNNPLSKGRWRAQWGYIVRLGGASTIFFSGEPAANVVGATASLLLEIDEAQDFDPGKYQRDFRPMASSTNATTVLYGTAWSENDLLAQQKALNLEAEAADGVRRHFEYPWPALAKISTPYQRFVEGERERLGQEHPLFITQYELRPLPGAERLFSRAILAQLAGEHRRITSSEWAHGGDSPYRGGTIVAGLDLAGGGPGERDATVLTLAALEEREVAGVYQPIMRIIEHHQWVGEPLNSQQTQLADLLGRVWGVQRVAIDATGLGAGVASFLRAALGPRIVEEVIFSQPSKSRLGYELLAAAGAGRVRMYADDDSPEWESFWQQAQSCRCSYGAGQIMRYGVPANEGHDDYIISLALCVHAAGGGAPLPRSIYIDAGDTLGPVPNLKQFSFSELSCW